MNENNYDPVKWEKQQNSIFTEKEKIDEEFLKSIKKTLDADNGLLIEFREWLDSVPMNRRNEDWCKFDSDWKELEKISNDLKKAYTQNGFEDIIWLYYRFTNKWGNNKRKGKSFFCF